MSRWSVGDRAVIVRSTSLICPYIGQEIRVTGNGEFRGESFVMVNLPPVNGIGLSGYACFLPEHLGPIPDDHSRFHADLISCDDDWTIPWSVTV